MAGESFTWKDPTGTSRALDGSGNYLALAGEQNNYAPPVALLDQRTPQRPGTTIRYQDIQPRILTYPLIVTASTEMNLRTAIRSLVSMFLSTNESNPGTLIATAPDGVSQRQISCYYYAGLDGDGSDQNRGPGWAQFALQLEAPDPFWQDTSVTNVNYTGPFTVSIFPTITVAGDYLTWPVITIHGPMNGFVVFQNTPPSGITYNFNWTLTMLSTDVLVIDTFAGTMTLNGTTNEISTVSVNTAMWALYPGANNLGINIAGSTGATTIQVTYRNRWWSC